MPPLTMIFEVSRNRGALASVNLAALLSALPDVIRVLS